MEDTAKYGECSVCGKYEPLDNENKCSVCGVENQS